MPGKKPAYPWRVSNVKLTIFLIFPSLLLLGFITYNLPPVKNRLAWRLDEVRAQIKYALAPPEQAIFVPQQGETDPLPLPQVHTATASPSPTQLPPIQSTTSPPTLPPTITPTSLPDSVRLTGILHEYQGWNNCGPATLAMALSYWGWQGDQYDIAAITKPNPRDKNVMPYELADYVEAETPFSVVSRVSGEVNLLRSFLAAGLPVIVEKGFEGPDFEGWMGHYVLVNGYNNTDHIFTLQDSYFGPDQVMEYGDLERYWRAFNFTYLVVYPTEREADVLAILGPQTDENDNNQYAAQKASGEILALSGRDQYFAWYNRGTNLVALQDYAGAAAAYDQSFALYPSILEKERPWRMMWYQTGPYWAYYYTGRYQDVIDLATTTLDAMSEPVLEESYYWRALAREAVGDNEGAIEDLQTSLKVHPGFESGIEQLERLGVKP